MLYEWISRVSVGRTGEQENEGEATKGAGGQIDKLSDQRVQIEGSNEEVYIGRA